MGLADDLKHLFRTKPAVYRSPGVAFENAVHVREMYEGRLPPTATVEVDAVAELIKKLAKGKKVKLPKGCSYDAASKTLSGPLAHAEKVKALLAAAITNGLLPAKEVSVEGNTLIVKIS